ncbi:MAG: glycosyltransferase family 39 protein, partial [Planctomycetales bacterium]
MVSAPRPDGFRAGPVTMNGMDPENIENRGRLLLAAAVVGAACWALLAATEPGMPIVWDEGEYLLRAEAITTWLQSNEDPTNGDSTDLDRQAALPFTTVNEGHPAGSGLLIALGDATSWFPAHPLSLARRGPIALFSLAAAAMFYRLARDRSPTVACAATLSLLCIPRMFAHAHFATLDGPLTACWILAWATFAPALRSRAAAVCWGMALGLAFSIKFTGWFALIPFLGWLALHGDRRAVWAFAIGLPVSLLTFTALNPPLWFDPITGLWTHFELNLTRGSRPEHNVTGFFLGRMYDLHHPLPWYNSILWTAITAPLGILILGGIGLGAALWPRASTDDQAASETSWRWRRFLPGSDETLLLGHWAILLVVRALPGAPPHDGIRLFLPSFAFLAILAGIGADVLQRRIAGDAEGSRWRKAAAVAAWIVLVGGGAISAWRFFPQELSHYNLLAGGQRGAVALGMEPTYWWDGLDRETLDWLQANTEPDRKIGFSACSPQNLRLLRRWGDLTRGTLPEDPGHSQ